jgi:hypothetical protein
MDLDFHDKSSFSDVFLEEYASVTGDPGFMRLLDFYKVYRAVIRGKVESLKLFDQNITDEDKISARNKAGKYFRLARGYVLRQGLPKMLIITCGLMGSGKSAIASALAFELGMEITSSDAVRKELANIPRNRRGLDEYGTGIYTPDFNEATYREMLKRSERALKAGRSMIVDATFRRKSDRLSFQSLAALNDVPFYIFHISCPEKLVKQRLDKRSRNTSELSDGRWELFYRQKDEFEPPGKEEGKLISIDTSRPLYDNIDDILQKMESSDGTQLFNKGSASSAP